MYFYNINGNGFFLIIKVVDNYFLDYYLLLKDASGERSSALPDLFLVAQDILLTKLATLDNQV